MESRVHMGHRPHRVFHECWGLLFVTHRFSEFLLGALPPFMSQEKERVTGLSLIAVASSTFPCIDRYGISKNNGSFELLFLSRLLAA